MSNKDLTKLALKIFSIYIFVQVILATPQFFQAYVMLSNGSEYNNSKWFMFIGAAAVVVLLLLSVAIWKLSSNTKEIISKNTDNSSLNMSEEFALSILGLYLIVYGLTRTIVVATSAYYSSQASNDINYDITQSVIYVAVYLVVSIVGMSLVIKSNGWSALLNKLRVAGT